MVKLNNSDNYESIGVIKLTKEKFPKAFQAKVEELIEEVGHDFDEFDVTGWDEYTGTVHKIGDVWENTIEQYDEY